MPSLHKRPHSALGLRKAYLEIKCIIIIIIVVIFFFFENPHSVMPDLVKCCNICYYYSHTKENDKINLGL